MSLSPFISTLSFHGVNISIVGNKSDISHDPSFVKEVVIGESGELIIGLEDIRDGRIILSIPKSSKPITEDILEKFVHPEKYSKNNSYAQFVEASPFVDDNSSKRQRVSEHTATSPSSSIAKVSPQDDCDEDDEPQPKKQMAKQSVKKKISLSREDVVSPVIATRELIASPVPITVSRSPVKSGKQPDARWGHTMTKVSNNRLVVYGGQSEEDQATGEDETVGNLFVYHPEEGTWLEPENCESIPRVWHTATYLPDMNLIVTFGGERSVNGNLEFLDDIMVLDTEIFLWYPPAVSGRSPTPRAGHSAALLMKRDEVGSTDPTPELVVFGGTRGRKWESSLHVLNCHRWEWSRPKISGKAPAARSYHSATPIHQGKSMVIFGGNDGDTCFNDVVVLSSSSSSESSDPSVTSSQWSWTRPVIIGEVPKPRTGHSACLLKDGKTLLIHGGWDPSDCDKDEPDYFEDAYTLNTENWEWSVAPRHFLEQAMQRETSSGGGITGHVMEVVGGQVGTDGQISDQMLALFGGQCANGERVNHMVIASI